MRPFFAALITCCLLAPSPVRGERSFPYKAYITTGDVYVRSGPGQSYYPTDKLKAGQEVEIYRHDPGGWYAIKPPDGSFSWMSGRFLAAGKDDLAIVSQDRVAARVGSRFSDIRDVVQVRLHKAEVVEVMEADKRDSGTTWYKIAPPSGEFRWVFGKYVDPDYPRNGLRKIEPAEARSPSPSEDEEIAQSSPAQEPTTARAPSSTVDADPFASARSDDRHELPYASAESRRLTPEQYRERLVEIDLELSTMVVEEPTVWVFDDMRDRTLDLFEQAQTALERGLTRVLLNKIDRFEDVKRRYQQVAAMRERTERVNRRLASLSPRDSDEHPRADADARYDGTGELTRVVSQKLDAPRYALIGEDGSVQCYVSPAPGVNLRHYVGMRVGVNGTRGYMPEQRTRHVMAKHVNVLEDRRLW